MTKSAPYRLTGRFQADGVIMIRSRKPKEGGPLLLATAILERLVEDARRGDRAAVWAAWAGIGPILADMMGIDDAAWQWRLRCAGIDRPTREPPEPPDTGEIAPQMGKFRSVGPGGAVLNMMGELPQRGRPRSRGGGLVQIGLTFVLLTEDNEGRELARRFYETLRTNEGDGRATVAELIQDRAYLARVARWADIAE